jgi:hypothetical protein
MMSYRGQMPPVPMMTGRVARAEFNSSRELSAAGLPVPVKSVQAPCEGDVSLAKITVQLYGFDRRRLGLGGRLPMGARLERVAFPYSALVETNIKVKQSRN